jgi:hypothetical protein
MPGSDLTDRTRTGPFHGSHLTDTVRRTAVGPVRRLSADSPRTADGPTDRSDGFEHVQKLLPVRVRSVSGPSDVNRERTGPRSVGAELTHGGGAK